MAEQEKAKSDGDSARAGFWSMGTVLAAFVGMGAGFGLGLGIAVVLAFMSLATCGISAAWPNQRGWCSEAGFNAATRGAVFVCTFGGLIGPLLIVALKRRYQQKSEVRRTAEQEPDAGWRY